MLLKFQSKAESPLKRRRSKLRAAWNAAEGRRGPALVKPETLKDLHRPRVKTGPLPGSKPGTPLEGEYALGWGVIKFEWTPTPVLEHNGSNSMNLAKILVDRSQDLGVVVMINFAPDRSEQPAKEVAVSPFRQAKVTERPGDLPMPFYRLAEALAAPLCHGRPPRWSSPAMTSVPAHRNTLTDRHHQGKRFGRE